jgi:hypothetical protein
VAAHADAMTGLFRVEGRSSRAQIGAGAERAACAGDHNRTDIIVPVYFLDDLEQLEHHASGEGVEPIRTVEGHGRYAVVDRILRFLEVFECHAIRFA